MATRFCPNCGSPARADQGFCPECGTRLTSPPPAAEGATQALPGANAGQSPSSTPWPSPPPDAADRTAVVPPAGARGQGSGYNQPPVYGAPPAQPPVYGGAPAQPPYAGQGAGQPPAYGGQPPAYGYPPAPAPAPARRSNRLPLILLLLGVLLVGGGAGAYFFLNRDDSGGGVATGPTATAQPTRTPRPTREAATDSPTLEPIATLEPLPTSDPGLNIPTGEIIISDDFSTTAERWPQQATDRGSYAYVDGYYQIVISDTQRILWTSTNESYSDVDVTIGLLIADGPEENAAGIILREQEDGGLYAFQISPTGEFAFRRFDKPDPEQPGEWTPLIDWTTSDAVQSGLNAVNTLRIVAVGSTFTLYINDQNVDIVIDDTYSSGYVGFGGSTFETGGATIHFDDLVVRYP